MIVEICANSFESARIAQECGAHRIELCTELSVGGLTPSHGLIEKVITQLDIPVHVLIRPRSGNFVYSEAEVDVMLRDIAYCKELGCAGIVSGVLTPENTIGKIVTQALIDACASAKASGDTRAEGMEFTFHRAFDLSSGIDNFDILKELGVTRLLSSGLKPKAIEGIEFLKKLKERSQGNVQIMPGSGINSTNALEFKKAGFEMVHFSAIKKENKSKQASIALGEEDVGTSDPAEILKIIKILS